MRHAVLDVRTTVLRDTTIPVDSMTQVLSHASKISCGGVRRMRRFGVVFTHCGCCSVVGCGLLMCSGLWVVGC